MKLAGWIAGAIGIVCVCVTAGAALARGDTDVAGKWKARATGMSGSVQTCDVTLKKRQSFGQYQASSFGCSGTLFGVSKWQIDGRRVRLLDAFGKTLATLHLRDGRLTGHDAKDKRVTLYRPGSDAGTSIPDRRRHDGWGRPGGDHRDRDCTVYADTGRCARHDDLRAPRAGSHIRMLAKTTNIRMFPDFDSDVVRAVKRGACFKVDECRRHNGARWCRVHRRGVSGYVVQTFSRDDETMLLFREGC